MSTGFIHSVKVPRFYKVTAKTVQTVEEEGASLKQLIYEKKHPNLQGTYALALTTIQHGPQLDQLLQKTQLLYKEPRFDPWLARVLITELLWGKNSLPSEAKPIKIILSYEKVLRDVSMNLDKMDVAVAANSNKVEKPRYVRINTLVRSVEDSIVSFTDDGWTLLPTSRNYSAFLKTVASLGERMFLQDFHIPELFAFPPGTHFHDHPGYQCGAIVLQDKASCIPAYLLNAAPGTTVLDMCAAPGMKTTHLAAIMKNTGNILAVERDKRRYNILCEMVKMNAADCVTTVNADAMKLDPKQYSDIEYILVDPSCSGSGMLDRIRSGMADSKCAPGRLISLQSFQVLLLRHALLNFPTVKRVVYSTCSLYPEENEMVVDEILGDIGDAYDLVPVTKLIGPDWKNFSSTDYKCKDRCLYARPAVDMSNGFFVAVFERNFEVPLPEYKRKSVAQKRKNNDQLISEDGKINGGNQLREKKRWRKSESNGGSKVSKMEGESIADDTQGSKNANTEEKPVIGKKHGSKSIKTECESVADQASNKGQTSKKQKKKRKEANPEPIENDEHVEVQSAINGDAVSVEKKKKKKKKLSEKEIIEVNGILETLPGEEQKIKKKKKKRSEVEILEEVSLTVEISDIQKRKKKKK